LFASRRQSYSTAKSTSSRQSVIFLSSQSYSVWRLTPLQVQPSSSTQMYVYSSEMNTNAGV